MNPFETVPFPRGQSLKQLLNLQCDDALDDLLFPILEKPIQDLYARPKKNLRGQLIELGAEIVSSQTDKTVDPTVIQKLNQILELIHTGSLIIDDIEDNSSVRRGKPSLHTSYGLSVALNAGNWLYFLPFKLIGEMGLPLEHQHSLLCELQQTLLLAHYGQALDVGVSVDRLSQSRVYNTALSSIELKSGVLTSFALKAAALAMGQTDIALQVSKWGRQFGVALQMYDDIGNFSNGKIGEKKFEDLKLKRLCFVLAVAAEKLSADEYGSFWKLAEDQTHSLDNMNSVLRETGTLEEARKRAERYLNDVIQNVELAGNSKSIVDRFRTLQKTLVGAYE